MPALVWLLLGVVLVIAEVFSGDFVLVMIGTAALASALAEAFGAGAILDIVIFVVLSFGLLIGIRPLLKRKIHWAAHSRTNVEALKGATATVVATVDEHGGQVRIGGDVWSARGLEGAPTLEPGQKVTVIDISGATAIVLADN